MAYGFHELIARAARTRDLVAGTVIGSGTTRDKDPLGPFTLMLPAAIVTSTPEGTGIGDLPTRDT